MFTSWSVQIMNTIRVFLSHASRENLFSSDTKRFVSALTKELKSRVPYYDFVVFVDEVGVGSAEDWRSRILTEVRRSHIFLFSGSQEWFESPWCTRELKEFVHAGRRKPANEQLQGGRAILRLKDQYIDFSKVPWLRRYNAHYAAKLASTRQYPDQLIAADGLVDDQHLAIEITKVVEKIDSLTPVILPGLREAWTFFPVGLRIIGLASFVLLVGIAVFISRNNLVDLREIRTQKGVFRTIVNDQADVYGEMRVGLNSILPSGLPSRLPTLLPSEGEAFSRQWGFAVADIERYFKPFVGCLESRSCLPAESKELCGFAEKAVEGHGKIFRFFNSGGDGRGFLFAMGGSRPNFEPLPGATVHEPSFRYTPQFYQLACTEQEETVLGGSIPIKTACAEDMKYALSWSAFWDAQASLGQPKQSYDQLTALAAIDERFDSIDGVNGVISRFSSAIEALKDLRRKRRPDVDPVRLDAALDDRLVTNILRMQRLIEPMTACINNALPERPVAFKDIPLGAGLLLDSFLDPQITEWLNTISYSLSEQAPTDRDTLVALMNALEYTFDSFMALSNDNYLRCQTLMDEMYTNPNFNFRLRNRRDSENEMRILSFGQQEVTTTVGELRAMCN